MFIVESQISRSSGRCGDTSTIVLTEQSFSHHSRTLSPSSHEGIRSPIQTELSSRSQRSDWRAGDQTLPGHNPEVKWLVAHPKLREGRKGDGRMLRFRVATLLRVEM